MAKKEVIRTEQEFVDFLEKEQRNGGLDFDELMEIRDSRWLETTFPANSFYEHAVAEILHGDILENYDIDFQIDVDLALSVVKRYCSVPVKD